MLTSQGPIQVLKVHEPGELVSMVPYLLGFHPSQSLVLVGLADNHVSVTARVDLDDLADPLYLPSTLRALIGSDVERLIAVVYDESASASHRWADLPEQLEEACTADDVSGLSVLDVLLVSGGRWWSLMCLDEACCPAAGRPLPSETTVAAAEATYAGMVALPSRKDLAALLEPVAEDQRVALNETIAEHEHRAIDAVLDAHVGRWQRSVKRAIFAAARKLDARDQARELSDADVARYVVALGEIAIRDSVWLAIDQGRLDGRGLWRELARRAPAPYDAAPLFLFGWSSWRRGEGAIAGIAAERALAGRPDYSAADLLLAALAHGLDPRRTPKLRLPKST